METRNARERTPDGSRYRNLRIPGDAGWSERRGGYPEGGCNLRYADRRAREEDSRRAGAGGQILSLAGTLKQVIGKVALATVSVALIPMAALLAAQDALTQKLKAKGGKDQ